MKTVIEMAREIWSAGKVYVGPSEKNLERFAELVRADAIAEEREACARFLESTNLAGLPEDTALHYARLLKGFAEGIRARSNT